MKNKKISPYVKLRRNLFNSNETAELMAEEGATGAGAFVLIMMYLAGCEDTVGSLHCLPVLAAKCHKSKAFVLHVIRDYGLFTVAGNSFYSASLEEIFREMFRKPTYAETGREMSVSSIVNAMHQRYSVIKCNDGTYRRLGRILRRNEFTHHKTAATHNYMVVEKPEAE